MKSIKNNITRAIWYSNVLQHIPSLGFEELGASFIHWKSQREIFANLYRSISLASLMAQSPISYPDLESPGILISFHFGPYRLLPRLMLCAGHRVALLASTTIIEREKAWYSSELSSTTLSEDVFSCIDASNPNSLRRILNAVLNENRTVLVFLDADEGEGEKTYEKVRLFEGTLYWRTNLFKLAKRFNIGIRTAHVEIGSPEDLAEPRIVFGKSGYGNTVGSLESVSEDFQRIMDGNWTAWENWSLLHRYDKRKPQKCKLDSVEPLCVMPCIYHGRKYFLDISNRQFFEIR